MFPKPKVLGQNAGPTLVVSFLVLALLSAFGLRVFRLGYQSFWYDEAYSLDLAQRDFATMIRLTAGDQHPPLYYLLLRAWAWLSGTSEFSLRYLSLILGMLIVPTSYALASRVFGKRVGLCVTGLAAGSPFLVYYSQESRMYTLMCLFAELAAYFFLRAAETGQTRYWAAYVVSIVLGLYSHLYVSLILAFLNLVYVGIVLQTGGPRLSAIWNSRKQAAEPAVGDVLSKHWWRPLADLGQAARGVGIWRYIVSQVAVVVLYLPWLRVALERFANFASPGGGSPLDWILTQTLTAFSLGYNVLSIGAYPGSPDYERDLHLAVVLSAPFLILACGGAIAMLSRRKRPVEVSRPTGPFVSRRSRAVFAGAYLIVPLVLIIILSAGKRDFGVRYLFAASPAYLLLVGAGLTALGQARKGWLLQGLAWLVLAGIWSYSLHNYYFVEKYSRDDHRSAVAYLRDHAMPGDLVVLDAPFDPVYQYYAGNRFPWLRVPEVVPTDHQQSLKTLASTVPQYQRVWLVMWNDYLADPQRVVQYWFDTNTFPLAETVFHGPILVYGYLSQSPVLPAASRPSVALKEDYGGQIALMGYDLQVDESQPRRRLHLTLYWQALQRMNINYSIFAHLLNSGGQMVGIGDSQPVNGHLPTAAWEPGQTIRSEMDVWTDPGTPPGDYRLVVGAYDPATMLRLPVGSGTFVDLQPVRLERRNTDAQGIDTGDPLSVRFEDDLELIGRRITQPAKDMLHVTLFWRAQRSSPGRYKVFNHLVDASGEIVAQRDSEPCGGSYPTDLWQSGEIVRDEYDITIPADLSGRYRLLTGLYHPETGERLAIRQWWPFGDPATSYQIGQLQLEP